MTRTTKEKFDEVAEVYMQGRSRIIPISSKTSRYAGEAEPWTERKTDEFTTKSPEDFYHFSDIPPSEMIFYPKETAFFGHRQGSRGYVYKYVAPPGTDVRSYSNEYRIDLPEGGHLEYIGINHKTNMFYDLEGENGFFEEARTSRIKSATGNRGTFDPTDPNILRQIEGDEETRDIEGMKGKRGSAKESPKKQTPQTEEFRKLNPIPMSSPSATLPDERILISIRLPRSLVERADKQVAKLSPTVRDRTQLIEIALSDYLGKKPS